MWTTTTATTTPTTPMTTASVRRENETKVAFVVVYLYSRPEYIFHPMSYHTHTHTAYSVHLLPPPFHSGPLPVAFRPCATSAFAHHPTTTIARAFLVRYHHHHHQYNSTKTQSVGVCIWRCYRRFRPC